MTDAIKLSVELRHTWEDEKVAATVNSTLIGCIGGQRLLVAGVLRCASPVPQNLTPTATPPFGTQTKSDFYTPRFTAEYEFSDDGMVYASAGKGQKPGGVLSLLAPTTTGDFSLTKFESEVLWVYEVGLKAEWLDNRLRTNADVYYQDFKNKQETGTRIGNDGLPVPGPGNAEKARVWGFEADVTAAASDNLTLNAAYTYIDAKYKRFNIVQTTAANIALAGNCVVVRPATGNPFCNVSYAGRRLALSPRHAFNVSAGWKQAFSADVDWFIEADLRYMGKRFTTFDNGTILNAFHTVDVRAGFESDNWQATFYVNNATDNDTLTAGGVALPDFTTGFIIPVNPGLSSGFLANLPDKRQFGVRLSYTY